MTINNVNGANGNEKALWGLGMTDFKTGKVASEAVQQLPNAIRGEQKPANGWEVESSEEKVNEKDLEGKLKELEQENKDLKEALKECEGKDEGETCPAETKPEPTPTDKPVKPVHKKPVHNTPVHNTPVTQEDNPPKEEGQSPVDKNESRGAKVLTDKEVREASADGKRVAKMLIGNTSENDQSTVKEVINDRVNADNVVEFLRGYDKEHGVRGDNFFEQLFTEYDFDDKGELMMNVAKKLSEYCRNHGDDAHADRLNDLIQKFESHQFTPTDVKDIVKKLDKAALDIIEF